MVKSSEKPWKELDESLAQKLAGEKEGSTALGKRGVEKKKKSSSFLLKNHGRVFGTLTNSS